MAESNAYTEWCLTPTGWVRGTQKPHDTQVTTGGRARDTIMSVMYVEFMTGHRDAQGRPWIDSLEHHVAEPTRHTLDSERAKQLIARYGDCPEKL
jgi:hypothetical protein